MVRAAAKNFNDVSIITDKKDYGLLISEINKTKAPQIKIQGKDG